MQYLLSSQEMKQCDANTMEHYGMVSAVLMERAALSVADAFMARFPDRNTSVLIACGTGNNGGDGIAIGRLLYLKGYPVMILFAGKEEKMTVETARQMAIARKYEIPMCTSLDDTDYDVVMDALFGIGLCREIGGSYRDLIQALNQRSAYRIAVDIASGVAADNGAILGLAFQADLTVTMGFAKRGQILYPGKDATGELIVADIGIDEKSLLDIAPRSAMIEYEDLLALPVRTDRTNKGSYGKLVIFAGTQNMAGAAVFAATAAYRMGTGLVRVVTVEENREILQTCIPEAVLVTYDETTKLQEFVQAQLAWADAVVAGPGLGTGALSETLMKHLIANVQIPCLIDADGLNLLAKHPEWIRDQKKGWIMTPHLGEMSRLMDEKIPYIKNHMTEVAADAASRYQATVVLKDARTITACADGFYYINTSGNHGMATAGSGDVLSGVIGALLAQKVKPAKAAALGVYIHGLAGDKAAEKTGKTALLASDLCTAVADVMKEYETNTGRE